MGWRLASFGGMGMLIDYYLAGSDASAAELGDDPEAATASMTGNGIEPTVMLATLETLLTGAADEEILASGGGIVGLSDAGAMIVHVRHQLVEAVAAADQDRLRTAAASWIESDELVGTAELDDACEWLDTFRELAVQARSSGLGVYAAMSL